MSAHKNHNSRLKILFTIPTLNGGGAERVFVNYIRSLDIKRYDISLLLIHKIGEFLELIPKYVNIIDLGMSKTRYGLFKLLKSIKNIDPDLIVSTTNRMNILILMTSFFIKRNIKICLYEPSMPSAQFGAKYLPRYYLLLMKILYKRSDYIIAQTDEMKSEIVDYYLVSSKKIIVTINPIDTALIDEQIINSDNPYNQSYINLVASGRIREEKGFVFLLNAFARVVKNNKKFKLYILGGIGSDSYMIEMQNIIQKYNLKNNVQFIGFKSNPFPYYKNADLFILSSKWEGLPNVVLETLYLETPVIVTDCIPFFRRLIVEGVSGFIVPYGDEIYLSQKIQQYSNLKVQPDMLDLPNYNKIFYDLINK